MSSGNLIQMSYITRFHSFFNDLAERRGKDILLLVCTYRIINSLLINRQFLINCRS